MGVLRQRRLAFVAAVSLALHALVLGWLAWPSAPQPARAWPRVPRREHREAAIAPAVVAHDAVAPVPGGVATVSPPASPSAAGVNLRAALQAGAGCARAASREAREACAEKLGRIAPGTPSYDAPMDPGKRAYYDAVVAAGPSGGTYGDPQPGAVTPGGAAYFRVLNCSVKFGGGKKPKDRQGELRLGRTPCSIPLQGSFFTPEASVRKR